MEAPGGSPVTVVPGRPGRCPAIVGDPPDGTPPRLDQPAATQEPKTRRVLSGIRPRIGYDRMIAEAIIHRPTTRRGGDDRTRPVDGEGRASEARRRVPRTHAQPDPAAVASLPPADSVDGDDGIHPGVPGAAPDSDRGARLRGAIRRGRGHAVPIPHVLRRGPPSALGRGSRARGSPERRRRDCASGSSSGTR